jgi:hypothetical protein
MKAMGYRWSRTPNGQFVDGHERGDVVVYRQLVILPVWEDFLSRTRIFIDDPTFWPTSLTEGWKCRTRRCLQELHLSIFGDADERLVEMIQSRMEADGFIGRLRVLSVILQNEIDPKVLESSRSFREAGLTLGLELGQLATTVAVTTKLPEVRC